MALSSVSQNLHTTQSNLSPFNKNLLHSSLLQLQNHSPRLNNSKYLKISITSCYNRRIHAAKTKRKPKPKFYEQIRDKWSLKITSPRENFPWQEQQQQQQQQQQVPAEDVKREVDVKQSVTEPLGFAVSNRFISAPWIHGKEPSKNQVGSTPEISVIGPNYDLGDETVKGSHWNYENDVRDASVAVVEEVKNVENEVNVSGEFQGEAIRNYANFAKEVKNAKEEAKFRGKFDGKAVKVYADVVEDVKNVEEKLNFNEKFTGEAVKIDANVTRIELDRKQALAGSLNGGVLRSRLPWEREGDAEFVGGEKKKSNTELAERMIPQHELQRLRNIALRMLERKKVGAAGITQALLDSIHEKWKVDEVIKLKFEEPLSLNMKRTHEILETKTGGLVIWRSGSSVVLFRGLAYKLHCVQLYTKQNHGDTNASPHFKDVMNDATHNVGVENSVRTTDSFISDSSIYMKNLSTQELTEFCELNHLLDELGPRFKDWSGQEPLPVDADLLPAVVPGYKTPFRLLPYGVRSFLLNKEMTIFRRLARTTPPHFALGRNRELQGLAKAMVKIWERSAIAKIAIKRGVENTRNERMAEELKKLTGGTLLSRNKEYIVFYRGNDFLPSVVTEALKERVELLTDLHQNEEELSRQTASAWIESKVKASKGMFIAGTLTETIAATSRWGQQPKEDVEEMMRDSALNRQTSVVRYLEKKLALAKGKLTKAEKALAKVQKDLKPAELPTDLEALTDEERFLFRKIGLSMKPYLPLGRRGVYDGTIENMHLHWKFRELVKIFVKGKTFAQVKHIAISLEAESGGVLISVDKTTKGYAIIVYHGKNYLRPSAVRPTNLLTRRQALARSIELQRREALKHHTSDLQRTIDSMKSELERMKACKNGDAENTLYSRVDDAYLTNDNIEEDKGEEAYLLTYDSSNEDSSNPNENMLERRPG
ncbi:CRS1_YhbY domain-containing protein [Cephalotus follicularis]|uniref:CRS1_YhbY domain-containing protein n=1 Tax=Cephalotus follicularis TaxID=3775 RepID=A0A1Q3CEH0_CEPFO|nr:CRS1_YhbY domain-containing protein [Cephalotus follicularis]